MLLLILLPANVWLAAKVVKQFQATEPPLVPASAAYRNSVQALAKMNQARDRDSAVVFVGDSLTFYFKLDEFFSGKGFLNRGVLSETATGLVKRWDSSVKVLKPRKIFILIGVNDIKYGLNVDVAKTLEPVLRNSRPGVIFLQSIFPVGKKYAALMSRIKQTNDDLKKMADATGQYWIDVHQKMADDEGFLRDGFTYDGIHLTYSGYVAWQKVLSEHLD